MKNLSLLLLLIFIGGITLQSCSKSKTYAEKLKEEKEAIQNFLEDNHINVIDVKTFLAQGSTTDVSKNEYVLFADNGVYMQIAQKGEGIILPDNADMRTEILCRFTQFNIISPDDTITNRTIGPDEMNCTRSGSTITGTFSEGVMPTIYQTNYIPTGLLIPLSYVYLGRNTANLAQVKLIIPSKQSFPDAAKYVYPCFYEITYQLGGPQ